jgi:hypothetical protein
VGTEVEPPTFHTLAGLWEGNIQGKLMQVTSKTKIETNCVLIKKQSGSTIDQPTQNSNEIKTPYFLEKESYQP